MKIHTLHLASFGKFKDKTIHFEDGINLIYGENEAGKSTVMAFIKAMLYGFTGRGADGDRKRYTPWDSTFLAGEMTVTLENGHKVIISRKSGKTPAQDECKILDAVTGEPYPLDLEAEIGLGENAFLKTVFIRQNSGALDGGDEELTNKLISLAEGGNGDTGYEDAIAVLKDGIRFYKHQRGDGGRIHEIRTELLKLADEIAKAREEDAEYSGYIAEGKELEQEISALQKKLADAEAKILEGKAGKAFRALEEAKKRADAFSQGVLEAEARMAELLSQKEQFDAFSAAENEDLYIPVENGESLRMAVQTKERNGKTFCVGLGLCAIISILSFFLRYALVGAGMLLATGVCFLLFLRQRKQIKKLSREISEIEAREEKRIRALSAVGCKTLKEYTEKKAEAKAVAEKINALSEKKMLLESETETAQKEVAQRRKETEPFLGVTPREVDISTAEKEKETIQSALDEKLQKSATIAGVLEGGKAGKKDVNILLSQQSWLLDTLHEAEEALEAHLLAAETLEAVFADLSRDFTPRINEKASRYLSQLTGQEEELLLDKKYAMTMGRDTHRPLKVFSGGTMDQAFLAVRLAISELVFTDKNMPIFLDDSFLQYDEKREGKAISLLRDMSKTRQVFWFSCRKQETQDINRIEL